MTESEAIEILRFAYPKESNRPITEEVISTAINALEKQIPKKVVRVKLRPTQWGSGVHCPVCESEQTQTEFFTVDGTEPNEKITWCSDCGQKLDWSDEE